MLLSTRKKIALGIKVFAYALVHLLLASVIFHPFNDLESIVNKFFITLMTGLFIIYVVVKWREYFEFLPVVVLVNILVLIGIYYPFYSHLHNLPEPDPSALSVMQRVQQGAVSCVETGKVLYTFIGGPRSARDGHPSIGFKLCDQNQVWEELPHGWKYNKVEDPETYDGNFLFTSQSFKKDEIICSEMGCTLIKKEE